ncbi:MAG: hypothetical protein ACMXYD_03330 [Candidatus Woesearchaeota archaeon]
MHEQKTPLYDTGLISVIAPAPLTDRISEEALTFVDEGTNELLCQEVHQYVVFPYASPDKQFFLDQDYQNDYFFEWELLGFWNYAHTNHDLFREISPFTSQDFLNGTLYVDDEFDILSFMDKTPYTQYLDLHDLDEDLDEYEEEPLRELDYCLSAPRKLLTKNSLDNYLLYARQAGVTVYSFPESVQPYAEPVDDILLSYEHALRESGLVVSVKKTLQSTSDAWVDLQQWSPHWMYRKLVKQQIRQITTLYAAHHDDTRFFSDLLGVYQEAKIPGAEISDFVQSRVPGDFVHKKKFFERYKEAVRAENFEQAGVIKHTLEQTLVPLFAEIRENHLMHLSRRKQDFD